MILKLPMFENGEYKYEVTSQRESCSEECLYCRRTFKAFHFSGLGRDGNHLEYPVITNNQTLIKKKNTMVMKNRKLTYNYEINPENQSEVFNFLQNNELSGVIKITAHCDCSYEMEFHEGKIAYKYSLPVTKHYELFDFIDDWNYEKFIDFVKKSANIIQNLHQANLIHGDLTAHNFMIDQDGLVKLIDLDNVTFGNEKLFLQDIVCYCLYTLFPIISNFEADEKIDLIFEQVTLNILTVNYESSWVDRLIGIILDSQHEVKSFVRSPLIMGYRYNVNLLESIYQEHYKLTNKVHQIQVELMEAVRVKDAAMLRARESFENQIKSATEYAHSLENAKKRYEDEVVNLNKVNTSLNEHITQSKDNFKEAENYAKTLEKEKESFIQRISSVEHEKLDIEKQRDFLEIEKSNMENEIFSLNEMINSKEKIISEQFEKIHYLENKSVLKIIKAKIFKR
ncbi:lipopolysaccharide kinase InaA family protein [Paenibacillus filicis]|uniref:Lipopolysaccharide kinase InaA family protein n=1 Tax=Paenibacillus filicis TaxID=669464 RepID=A0ABU9DSD1_9BACL